jgi:hypothetical protein
MLVEIDDHDVCWLENLLSDLKPLAGSWEHGGWAASAVEYMEHFIAKIQGKKCEDCGADPAK